MAERARLTKPGAEALAVGRRDDPAERRVAARLTDEPDLAALHAGALDEAPRVAEDGGGPAPAALGGMLAESGAPLAPGLRGDMERAFGESFGDVRLHTGSAAAEGARAMGAAAFSAGSDVGFAAGAYRPQSAAGRGIIAHELAHVSETRAGRDGAGVVRRIGPIEWLARLFGGGTFSDAELSRFVGSLTAESYQPHYSFQTDNMAREIVRRKLHNPRAPKGEAAGTTLARASELRVRFRLIQHLLDGFASRADQEAVLQILRDSPRLDREHLVQAYTPEALYDKFGGARLEELTALIEGGPLAGGKRVVGTRQSERGAIPVTWKMNYKIDNAGELGQIPMGLALEDFRIRPDGEQAAWTTLRERALLDKGIEGHGLPLTEQPVPHPKNTGGRASLKVWVVPSDRNEWDDYERRTKTVVPRAAVEETGGGGGGPGAPYGAISSVESQEVEASVEVTLGAQGSGSVTDTEATTTREKDIKGETKLTGKTEIAGETRATTEEESAAVAQRERAAREEARTRTQSESATVEEMRSWEESVSRVREEFRELEVRGTFETEKEKGGSETTEYTAEIGREVARALEKEAKIPLGQRLSVRRIGKRVLGLILRRVRHPWARVLGGLLSLIPDADDGVQVEVKPSGTVTVSINFSRTKRAETMWREAERRGFQIGRRSGSKDVTETGTKTGGATTTSQTEAESEAATEARRRERELETSRGRRRAETLERRTEQQIREELSVLRQMEVEEERSRSRAQTRALFIPVVRSARLSFKVMKGDPLAAEKAAARAGSGGRARRRGG